MGFLKASWEAGLQRWLLEQPVDACTGCKENQFFGGLFWAILGHKMSPIIVCFIKTVLFLRERLSSRVEEGKSASMGLISALRRNFPPLHILKP